MSFKVPDFVRNGSATFIGRDKIVKVRDFESHGDYIVSLCRDQLGYNSEVGEGDLMRCSVMTIADVEGDDEPKLVAFDGERFWFCHDVWTLKRGEDSE